MAMPAYRRTANLRLSVQALVGNSIAVASVDPTGAPVAMTVPVHHETPWGDPDGASEQALPERAWVATTWLTGGGGRRGFSLWQVDVYVRVGAPGDPDGDEFGIVCDDIADAVESVFAGARPSGALVSWLPLYDYAIPTAPVETGAWYFCQAPGADAGWGVPTERTPARILGGFRRVTLRFAFRLQRDAVPGLEYREPA